MPWREELVNATVLSAVILGVMVAAELWMRIGNPKPEWTRKLIHVGACGACMAFPFALSSPVTVLVMTSSFAALMACGRRFGFLKSLHSVKRTSGGTHYYPLAIFLLFLFASDRPWLFVSAVLVLGVSDALAALIGGQYGVLRYRVDESEKSLEGSLVFMVVAFLAIHLPMLLMTDLPRETWVLTAIVAAALATAVEAVCIGGSDNLFVPIVVFFAIDRIAVRPSGEIADLGLGLLAILLAIGLVAWRSRGFNVGGALAFVLFGFTAWTLGPLHWALPFFIGLAVYLLFWFIPPRTAIVPAAVVLRALLPSFLALGACRSTPSGEVEPALPAALLPSRSSMGTVAAGRGRSGPLPPTIATRRTPVASSGTASIGCASRTRTAIRTARREALSVGTA